MPRGMRGTGRGACHEAVALRSTALVSAAETAPLDLYAPVPVVERSSGEREGVEAVWCAETSCPNALEDPVAAEELRLPEPVGPPAPVGYTSGLRKDAADDEERKAVEEGDNERELLGLVADANRGRVAARRPAVAAAVAAAAAAAAATALAGVLDITVTLAERVGTGGERDTLDGRRDGEGTGVELCTGEGWLCPACIP